MHHRRFLGLLFLAAPLAGCAHLNVRSANSYETLVSPAVRHPDYDPYAAYGEANATWRPLVADRNGTIVSQAEPSSQSTCPDYEHSEWASGASKGSHFAPAGTF